MNLKEKPVILVATRGFWNERELANQEILKNQFEMVQFSDMKVSAEIAQRTVALVVGDALVDRKFMDLFPNLKTIARNGTGYDNLDLAAARSKGITITRVSGLNAKPVSEFALGLILALSRNVLPMHENMLKGVWQKRCGNAFPPAAACFRGVRRNAPRPCRRSGSAHRC